MDKRRDFSYAWRSQGAITQMPAISNTFLFVEPDDNFLDYGSIVLHKIVELGKKAGQTIIELQGADANPERIRQELTNNSPLIFVGIGHGSESVFTCQNLAPLLHAENPEELALMKDRVVSLCSCLTATLLGPALIDAGSIVYTGYRQEFWFYTGDKAGTTRAVQAPFLAEFSFINSLLQGKNTGEARADQLARYNEEIDYWNIGEGKNHADAPEIARILELNKSISIFLGESTVSPSPQTGTVTEGLQVNPLITFGVASIPLAYLIYKATI